MKRTPLHRRTPLRRVSLKRQRLMQQRRVFVADQLQFDWAEGPDGCDSGSCFT